MYSADMNNTAAHESVGLFTSVCLLERVCQCFPSESSESWHGETILNMSLQPGPMCFILAVVWVAYPVYPVVKETLCLHVYVCYLPREVFLPRLGMGLGRRPLPMPEGLVLFPENRLCVGDVGEWRASTVLGLAERFSGCVDPSSCQWDRWNS